MTRSFEKINYLLRPNKNVERKMIARTLQRMEPTFAISKYRYVGFGSLWFPDFVIAHRQLGIDDLVTIEKEVSRTKRVEFNRPYKCVKVEMRAASEALPTALPGKPSIVWLDYDGGIESALDGDIDVAISHAQAGSVIIVSVNAEVAQLKDREVSGKRMTETEFLAHVTGDDAMLRAKDRLTARDFPELIAEILLRELESATLSRRPELEFVPIWNFRYADGAAMVTVGGFIGDESQRERLHACNVKEDEFASGTQQYFIDLPILTNREKRAFDQHLPSAKAIKPQQLPFELRDTEIAAYQKYYLYFPIFSEIFS